MVNRRKFQSPKLLLATNNSGKVTEMAKLLEPFGIEVVTAASMDIPSPEETGTTFEDNSREKALYYAKFANLPALADDSGLCVNLLDGQPGIYSARWAGIEQNYELATGRVQEMLGDNPDRTAKFKCVLTLAWPDGHTEVFHGEIPGEIATFSRGIGGFGYDSIFIPEGFDKTFAEMQPIEKQTISHRARALEALIEGVIAS